MRFLRAADDELTGHISPWAGGIEHDRYPARERTLFALEEDIHRGHAKALRLPPYPRGHPRRTDPAEARRVNLPGVPQD